MAEIPDESCAVKSSACASLASVKAVTKSSMACCTPERANRHPGPVRLTSLPRSTIWRHGSMLRRVAFTILLAKGEVRSA